MEREILMDWLIEALEENEGSATIVEVCETIWQNHERDLRARGDLFYTWQYDVRWAAQQLRDRGQMHYEKRGQRNIWILTN